MPFARPTAAQLRDRIAALYRTRFPGADTNLRHSPDRALVELIAASTDEDLAYLDWQVRQLFPFSADTDYLERWSAAKGLARKAASKGAGTLSVGGTVGASIDVGQQLISAAGVSVVTTTSAIIGGAGTAVVGAEASAGGVAGNLGTGTVLTFVGTPLGFADQATVATDFAGGADAEADASLRLRTLRALAEPSFGGNQNDWQREALQVAGVTRVFTSAATPTPGAVTIWPLFDELREDGIPVGTDARYRPGDGASGTGDQRLVLDAVLALRPICAHVYVKALVPAPINVTIANMVDDTPALREAIALELRRMLLRRAEPAKTIVRTWISEAVSRAAGEDSHDFVLPASNVTVAWGQIATLGTVTYT